LWRLRRPPHFLHPPKHHCRRKTLSQSIFIKKNIKFKIYRPIFEQGIPSELTAAVLNFPNREGDGGEKGLSELLLTSANLNITFV
jgi:hypothetical protein